MPAVVIRYKGQEQHLTIRRGLGFQALCGGHQTPIEFDCRAADCGICIIHVTKGMEHLNPAVGEELDFLKAMHADADERLACQCRIMGDVELLVDEA